MLRVRAGRGILASTSCLFTPSAGPLRVPRPARTSTRPCPSRRLYSSRPPRLPAEAKSSVVEDEGILVEVDPDDLEPGDEAIQVLDSETELLPIDFIKLNREILESDLPEECRDDEVDPLLGAFGQYQAGTPSGGDYIGYDGLRYQHAQPYAETESIPNEEEVPPEREVIFMEKEELVDQLNAEINFYGDSMIPEALVEEDDQPDELDMEEEYLRAIDQSEQEDTTDGNKVAEDLDPEAQEEEEMELEEKLEDPIFETLTQLLSELSLPENVNVARRFRGVDSMALRELLARLEEPPLEPEEWDEDAASEHAAVGEDELGRDTAYWMWHLKDLYVRNGAKIDTEVFELESDAPPYIPDENFTPPQSSVPLDPDLSGPEENPLSAFSDDGPGQPFPDLMTPDPLMDSRDEITFPPDKQKGEKYGGKVVIRNHYPMIYESMKLDGAGPFAQSKTGDESDESTPPSWKPTTTDLTDNSLTLPELASLPSNFSLDSMYIFPLYTRRVVSQTSKGRQFQIQVFTVIGDGNGLLGLGMGKDDQSQRAYDKALINALRSLDYVQRFEDRTIPYEIEQKFHATKLVLRPRPPGFGLRCSPIIHQILKAAGIKDISAKIWGSRNKVAVMQGLVRILHAGSGEPLGMGDGKGGKGRRKEKGGWGIRTREDIERDRGRKLVDLKV